MKLLFDRSFLGRYEDSDDLFFACEFRDKVSLLKDSDNKQSSEPFQRGVRRGSVWRHTARRSLSLSLQTVRDLKHNASSVL